MRDLLEGDDDFRNAGREAFAGADVEGNAGPAPVGDFGLDGDEGFGVGNAAFQLFQITLDRATAEAPARYWPRTVSFSTLLVSIGFSERRTFSFSSRTASAFMEAGGSMATRQSSWRIWFCTMSRSAPALS